MLLTPSALPRALRLAVTVAVLAFVVALFARVLWQGDSTPPAAAAPVPASSAVVAAPSVPRPLSRLFIPALRASRPGATAPAHRPGSTGR